MPIVKEDKLTLKVTENNSGGWWYAVYTGDGSIPGSLKSGAGGFEFETTATQEGLDELVRWVEIRECDHDWQPWGGLGDSPPIPKCSKCNIVDWREDV